MKTLEITTRFMIANKTDEIFDEMASHYGMDVICSQAVDFEEALFSNGFINAMENDLIPILGSEHLAHEQKSEQEYHHFILNDKCYVIYFEEK